MNEYVFVNPFRNQEVTGQKFHFKNLELRLVCIMESGDNRVVHDSILSRDRLENFQFWVTFTPIPGLHT